VNYRYIGRTGLRVTPIYLGTMKSGRYMELAKKIGISPVTLAVAYSNQFEFVASTIVGARDANQLDDSFAAMELELSAEVMKGIESIQRDIMYPMG